MAPHAAQLWDKNGIRAAPFGICIKSLDLTLRNLPSNKFKTEWVREDSDIAWIETDEKGSL